jgi:aerobic-type carbon monoxide dehydrogenase small subunit (CoxS/CutS family)
MKRSGDKGERKMEPIRLEVNGETYETVVKPGELLSDVLRERLGLTGTKRGCDSGKCGACTVLLDGKAVKSCLLEAAKAQDKKILTIEGLADAGRLDPLQEAFIEYGAVQCGYCTPGMIMTAKALLLRNPNPSTEEIKRALSGNLCRCTGYVKIIEAIQAAASKGAPVL